MSRDAKPTVVFTPSGLTGEVDRGMTALEAARAFGVDLDSVCGGRGICGRCQVEPGTGEFPKWAITATKDSISPPGSLEHNYAGKRPIEAGRRLGCGLKILGDIVFDVPPESQIHKQVVRKEVNLDGLVIDPSVTLHYLQLDKPNENDGGSLDVHIAERLSTEWNIEAATIGPEVLPYLHAAANDLNLTVAVRSAVSRAGAPAQPTVVGAWPGFVDRVVGVAIDIGSTTVAGHLCDLTSGEVLASAGRMNPQIRFGEDLMSRVSYVMMNPGGDVELTSAIRSALDELVEELVIEAQVDHPELNTSQVLDVVLVGNPIMHHLVLGIDPTPLGQAPFTLATAAPVQTRATDLDLSTRWASVYLAPCIAGHVGADTAAAILSEGPHRSPAIQLLVDVGTNAEIVLGNSERIFAASSPTGPAFEGAQISAGQRATAGAIERVRIDRKTLEPRFKVIGSDLWSDEDGFSAATAKTGVSGICGSGIIEVISELFLSGLIDSQGVIVPAGAERTARVAPDERTFSYSLSDHIRVTQADVRAIQLAKAALRAGIDLLLERAELDAVDEVRLAGAFGAHIDPIHAMVLGLIPDCPPSRVSAVGNAAGSGAVRALLSVDQRLEMEQVVGSVTKIETAVEPRFQELFVAALAFPHLSAPSIHLSQAIDLPAQNRDADGTKPRRRRRSRTTS